MNVDRLIPLLAAWRDLWEVLERMDPETFNRTSGRPFTDATPAPSSIVMLDQGLLTSSEAQLLQRAARMWGGSYDSRTGNLTGCNRLCIPLDRWHVYVS